MTPERWLQIEELFHRALECEPAELPRLLDDSSHGDLDLRSEVESLLRGASSAAGHLQAAVSEAVHSTNFPLEGTSVSHFRVIEGLGCGGMGVVYRAEDLRLGRLVALKFLPEEMARDPRALTRFKREARTASALNHPHICTVYEIDEVQGQAFLAMELLEGSTLKHLINGRPLPAGQLLELAMEIVDALEAAHAKGIIHRDIKPANIFVTGRGQAKLLDFGLAKFTSGTRFGQGLLDETSGPADEEGLPNALRSPIVHSYLTMTGTAMGTAAYMSPEQARGEEVDARTDLFSFGAVLYEMAVGRQAFTGATLTETRDAILNREATPARNLNPSVDPRLDVIIEKALAKDREVVTSAPRRCKGTSHA